MEKWKSAKIIRYTLRGVPADVDQILRRRAEKEGRSLNDIALEALREGVGLAGVPVVYNDLDGLIGTWVEDPAFDAALAEQDQV